MFQPSRGSSLPGCVLFLLIFFLIGIVGFKFGEAGWTYLQMREKTREALTWAVAGQPKAEVDIYTRLIANSRDAGVEVTHRNIRLLHSGDSLFVTVAWTQEVHLGYVTLPLRFKITLHDVKRWVRGNLVVK